MRRGPNRGWVVLMLACACSAPTATPQVRRGDAADAPVAGIDDTLCEGPWAPSDLRYKPTAQYDLELAAPELVKAALGKHETPVTWRYEEAMTYGVEGTRTTLRVEVTLLRGPCRFVDCETYADDWMVYECTPELRIPVHVEATTGDGVVAIEGDSELVVTSEDHVALELSGTQRGTLRICELREADTVVSSFGIVLGFRPDRTMVGAIGGGFRCGRDNCLHIPYAYACFPDRPPFRLDTFVFGACRRSGAIPPPLPPRCHDETESPGNPRSRTAPAGTTRVASTRWNP